MMGPQGTSMSTNRPYDEQNAVPWGKVALYGAGAAAGYGLIRAGAMKMKGLAPDAKGIMGGARRIAGMSQPGGWKGFQQLGASAGDEMMRGRIDSQIHELHPQRRAWDKKARSGSSSEGRWKAQGRADKMANLTQAQKNVQKARAGRKAAGRGPRYAPFNHPMADMEDVGFMGREAHWRARAKLPPGAGATRGGGAVAPYASRNPFEVRTRELLRERSSLGGKPSSGLRGAAQGAAGFFGAMDYAGGGLKRFGVGAARVGAGLAAVGIGMKALSWLNPFSD